MQKFTYIKWGSSRKAIAAPLFLFVKPIPGVSVRFSNSTS